MLRALVGGALAHLFRRPARREAGDRDQLSLDFAPPTALPASPALHVPAVEPRPATPRPRHAPAPRAEVAVPPPLARPAPSPSPQPRTADALLARLRALGLRTDPDAGGIARCRLTRNRTVMVSFRRGELRVHRGYLDAPDEVLRAVVDFVQGRTRAQRAAARRVILEFPVRHEAQEPGATRVRARERTRPEDEPMVRMLVDWHRRYNERHFGGALSAVSIRVSRRLRSRLGHYTAATADGQPGEIVIGRSHIRRHGWEEALHTLLHEMVHQWQDESGLPVDHGAAFRRKARAVGITAAARRAVGQRRDSAA